MDRLKQLIAKRKQLVEELKVCVKNGKYRTFDKIDAQIEKLDSEIRALKKKNAPAEEVDTRELRLRLLALEK